MIQARLHMENPPLPRNPGAFNYATYLQRQSIFWIGKGKGLQTLHRIGTERSLITLVDQIHHIVGKQLERLYPNSEVEGFLKGLLLGDRYEVPMEWEEQYRTLGLVHILSISGFHVSLLVGFLFLLLRSIGMTREKVQEARKRNIPLYIAPVGQVWEIESGVTVTFLYPNSQDDRTYQETSNNAGVVLLFTIDRKHILFTGDIEQNAEEKILKTWNLPKIDIYKVAHHGSKTSSTEDWIRKIQPRYALISVGEKNRYGHPSQEVIDRLQKIGTQIFRTDKLGAVTVRIDEDKMQFVSMFQRKEE